MNYPAASSGKTMINFAASGGELTLEINDQHNLNSLITDRMEQVPPQIPEKKEPERRKPRRPSALENIFGQVISGNFLIRPEVRKQYPYILTLAVLMFLYIANGYYVQKLHRRNELLTDEIKELRARSLTLTSQRMTSTRQSEIIRELEKRGIPLIEATEPPYIIKK